MRAAGTTAPVVFLTARDGVTDRLSGFAAGGDDYLTKPFHIAELVARLQVAVRRSSEPTAAARLTPRERRAAARRQSVCTSVRSTRVTVR
jgi:DNA-binding response OmpR family regulator